MSIEIPITWSIKDLLICFRDGFWSTVKASIIAAACISIYESMYYVGRLTVLIGFVDLEKINDLWNLYTYTTYI